MQYNTQQKKLIMPEYGRHVHQMVEHAIGIENRDERNNAAYTIIGVMGALMPHLRDVPDFKHKLWNHLLFISDFKLDIDAPYPPPAKSEMVEKPALVNYPHSHIRQKHYGKILVEMIRETGKLEDCPQRDSLISLLVTQMRKAGVSWNRSEINQVQIMQDIWDISDGKIKLNPNMPALNEHIIVPKESSHNQPTHHGMGKKKKKMKDKR